jgi:hypothetical protein
MSEFDKPQSKRLLQTSVILKIIIENSFIFYHRNFFEYCYKIATCKIYYIYETAKVTSRLNIVSITIHQQC